MSEYSPNEEIIAESNAETSAVVDVEGREAVRQFDNIAGFPEVNFPPAEDVLEQLKNRDPELAALVEAGEASLIPETIE